MSAMSASEAHMAPPFYPLSDHDHAALVVLAAVIFLIYAIMAIVAKLLIRLNITSLKGHDAVLLAGTLLYVIETACIIVACNSGLGKHRAAISHASYDETSKLVYTSRALALLVEVCTKISLCLLIRQISNKGLLNMANLALGGLIVVWAVTGFFAVLFQCRLPSPWLALSEEQCPSRGPIYMYNGVMNILTDVALCILPVAMMWEVHTTRKRKAIVIALFGTRVIVPIVTIPSLTNAAYLFSDFSDSTWRVVPSLVWFQVSLGLSVLTACIPSLKGIVDSLLGSTAVAAVQAPYDLRTSDKGSGMEMTALRAPGSTASKKRQSDSHLKLTTRSGDRSSNRSGNRSGKRASYKPGSAGGGASSSNTIWGAERGVGVTSAGNTTPEGTESVRGLTEGVVMVRDEFEIRYEDTKRTSMSRDGSQESSLAAYHNHV